MKENAENVIWREKEREESSVLPKAAPSLRKARGKNRAEAKMTRHQRGSDESIHW